MRRLIEWWSEELRQQPVLAFWMIVFVVHAGMNAMLGYTIGGGEGVAAWLYAACFIGFAGLGAWAADQYLHGAKRWRSGLLAMAVAQFLVGQMAGWQSFGLTLNRGAASLESKAETRTTTHQALQAARAELASLGIVRPVAAIEADAVLECEKKSRTYKDGVGPNCTKLRVELETAKRARHLETEIGRLTGTLAAGPNIKDPNALYAAPQALAQGVANMASAVMGGAARQITPDDVRFGWMIFLVAVLEFFGTFGLALLRSGPSDGASGGGVGQHATPVPSPAPSFRDAVEAVIGTLPRLPSPEPAYALPSPASASASTSPINLYFQAPVSPASVTAAAPASAPPLAPGPQTLSPDASTEDTVARFERIRAEILGQRHNLPALPADAPPVDRSRIARALSPDEREAADVVLSFRAACVANAPGGVIDGQSLFRRYERWAGERALAETAFHALFVDVTGVEAADIGGLRHYRNVALRAARKLEAVA